MITLREELQRKALHLHVDLHARSPLLDFFLLLYTYTVPFSSSSPWLTYPQKMSYDDKKLESAGSHEGSLIADERSWPSKADGQVVLSTDDGAATTFMTPAAERAVVWKFDLRILPVLAVMVI